MGRTCTGQCCGGGPRNRWLWQPLRKPTSLFAPHVGGHCHHMPPGLVCLEASFLMPPSPQVPAESWGFPGKSTDEEQGDLGSILGHITSSFVSLTVFPSVKWELTRQLGAQEDEGGKPLQSPGCRADRTTHAGDRALLLRRCCTRSGSLPLALAHILS